MVVQGVLNVWDYLVAVVTLAASLGIGLYHAFSGGRQSTTKEFLLADRKLGIFPVAMSIIASYLSATSLLGVPTEVYTFGARFFINVLSYAITVPVTIYFFLPVFRDANVTSTYEYLEKRFDGTIRKAISLLFIVLTTFIMAMCIYAPALALNQVTGLNMWGSVIGLSMICILYTTFGGMKAVVYTDVLQLIVMLTAIFAVIIKGLHDIGGLEVLLEKSEAAGRLNFKEFDPSPFVRHTFWSLSFGASFTWLVTFGVNQSLVQRYLSTPSTKHSESALWWSLFGVMIIISLYCFCGLIIFTKYADCDPLLNGEITSRDQMIPYFVMDIFQTTPGIPGLFVAGIFSAALSTMSSGLNALSAVTIEDFVWPRNPSLSDKQVTKISKLAAIAYGVVSVLLVIVAENLGSLIQMALSIWGIFGGPILGVFMLGLFYPWSNSKSAIIGLIAGVSLSLTLAIGIQITPPYNPKLPFSTSKCPQDFNLTMFNFTTYENTTIANFTKYDNATSTFFSNHTETWTPEPSEPFLLFQLSYMWFSAVSSITVLLVGMLFSIVTGQHKTIKVDQTLISPPIQRLYRYLNLLPEMEVELHPMESVKFLEPNTTKENTSRSIVKINKPEHV